MSAMTIDMAWNNIDAFEREYTEVSEAQAFTWLNKLGFSTEINTRLQGLWRQTEVIGGKLVHIGRILVAKIIEFCEKHIKLIATLALGELFTLALSYIAASIPLFGFILAPIIKLLGTLGTLGAAAIVAHYEGGIVNTCKDFFSIFIDTFTILKNGSDA